MPVELPEVDGPPVTEETARAATQVEPSLLIWKESVLLVPLFVIWIETAA